MSMPSNFNVHVAAQLGVLGLPPDKATVLLYEINGLVEKTVAEVVGKVVSAIQEAHQTRNEEIVKMVTTLVGQGGGMFGGGLSHSAIQQVVSALNNNRVVYPQPNHTHNLPEYNEDGSRLLDR